MFVQEGEEYHEVEPADMIAFTTEPAEGAEPADFGLCRYPAYIRASGRLATGRTDWCWSCFCKTQYASNPALGGEANFLAAHLGIVAMLDFAGELGILGEVVDEGGFWQKRDRAALLAEVHRWNTLTAAFAGALRDRAGRDRVAAEIARFPDYEHLEAKGQDQLPNPDDLPDELKGL